MSVLRETCLEYFHRRIREGWKCISLEGHKAVLQSPEGILRPIDLRNDVETLRPNGVGNSTEWLPFPTDIANWECVDEVTTDEYTTYIFSTSGYAAGDGYHRISIRENGVTTDSADKITPDSFGNFSNQWDTRPSDSNVWTWADIDNLEIGINDFNVVVRDLFALPASSGSGTINFIKVYTRAERGGDGRGNWRIFCTQIYVEIDFTPAVVGIGNKSASMAAKMMAAGLL